MTIIKPTVGRVVWFWRGGKLQREAGEQPEAALVAHVHSDSCVNLAVFDPNGNQRAQTSVALEQEPGDADWSSSFASWMPYQVGQAKKDSP